MAEPTTEERETVTVTIAREAWKKAKIAAVEDDLLLSEWVERAIETYLKGRKSRIGS